MLCDTEEGFHLEKVYSPLFKFTINILEIKNIFAFAPLLHCHITYRRFCAHSFGFRECRKIYSSLPYSFFNFFLKCQKCLKNPINPTNLTLIEPGKMTISRLNALESIFYNLTSICSFEIENSNRNYREC